MINAIIISPDAELAQRLAAAVQALTNDVAICRTIDRYPPPVELMRTLRAHAPELVLLSFGDVAEAASIVRFLETEASGLQIVAFHRHCDAPLLKETMRAGVREFLVDPFDRHSVLEALRNVKTLLERRPPVYETTDQIVAFLPSKAGVGATTLALNMADALARRGDSRVALADLDLNSGMLRFLLKLTNEYSVVDAVENALRMDETLWPQLVTKRGNLDVLHAGHVNPNLRIEHTQVRNLVQFMRRNYGAVFFDLSGNLERYSLEVMQEAKRVILVCTPEIPSLHLAREKLAFLKGAGLDTRVSLVLNRVSKRPLFSKEHVEEVLNMPVAGVFANDYHAVSRATTAGACLEPNSVIGRQCAEFAKTVLQKRPSAPAEPQRKFLQYFTVNNQLVAAEEK